MLTRRDVFLIFVVHLMFKNKLFFLFQQLTGLCLTFVRTDGKAISVSNVSQVITTLSILF